MGGAPWEEGDQRTKGCMGSFYVDDNDNDNIIMMDMSTTEGSKFEGLHDYVMAKTTTFCLPDDNAADLWAMLANFTVTTTHCHTGWRPQLHHSRLRGLHYDDMFMI